MDQPRPSSAGFRKNLLKTDSTQKMSFRKWYMRPKVKCGVAGETISCLQVLVGSQGKNQDNMIRTGRCRLTGDIFHSLRRFVLHMSDMKPEGCLKSSSLFGVPETSFPSRQNPIGYFGNPYSMSFGASQWFAAHPQTAKESSERPA